MQRVNTRVACPPSFTQSVYFVRSLFFRRNSVEVTPSRGNLDNKSCQFAPMATQTRPKCASDAFASLWKYCNYDHCYVIQTLIVHPTHSAKNTASRKISHDFSVFPEATSASPRQLFFSICFVWYFSLISLELINHSKLLTQPLNYETIWWMKSQRRKSRLLNERIDTKQ